LNNSICAAIADFNFCLSYLSSLKGDLAYNYRGPRTKDDIIEFANRVAG